MAPTSGLTAEGCLCDALCPSGRQLWVIGHRLVELGAWAKAAAEPSSIVVTAKAQNRIMAESLFAPSLCHPRPPRSCYSLTKD